MEYIPFILKRGHHASLKLLRPIAKRYGLTPARFDLLYAIHSRNRFTPFQAFVARQLGVSRATVCKMIRAMRAAGLVELRVNIWDRRFRRIKLTRLGRRCFRQIFKLLRTKKIEAALLEVIRALPHNSRALCREFLERMVVPVTQVSRRMRDTGDLYRGVTYC